MTPAHMPHTPQPCLPDVPAMMHMTVQDMVDATPLGPILDTPVADVLTRLGLPPLPVLPPLPPMPGLPPMPTINLDLLIKPMTDLLGGFGTGDLSKAGFDPSAIFQSLSKVLETTMTMSKGALGLADKLWAGQSSLGAGAKTAQASTNSAALATQGTGMSFDINAAAAIVAHGLAAVQAIIAATVAKIAAVVPMIVSPAFAAGIGLAVGFANLGLGEATAAVAATRAALLAPTGKMTVNGTKVPVTNAPKPAAGPSPFAIASSVLDVVSPALSTAVELPSALAKPVGKMITTINQPDRNQNNNREQPKKDKPAPGGPMPHPVGKGGARVTGAALGGLGMVPALNNARTTVPITPAAVESPGANVAATPVRGPGSAQAMPMGAAPLGAGAAGMGRTAGASADQHAIADYLVSEINGQRIVGDDLEVVPAVLGHDETPEPDPAPDIELRLGPPSADTTRK